MPLFGHGQAPKYLRLGDRPVVQIRLGSAILFDGTTPAAVSLPRATASAAASAPVIGAGAVLTLPTATAVCEALAPTVTAGARVLPGAAQASADALVPTIAAGAAVELPVAEATATANTPTIQTTTTDEILLPRATATAAALAPTVTVPVTIEPAAATAVSEALLPTITAGAALTLPAAAAAASALVPDLAAGAALTLPAASASASALVPSVAAGAAVTLPAASASASALVPSALALASYHDDFNRTTGLGSNWTTDTSSPCVIVSNKLQITAQSMGASATSDINTWASKMLTDNHEVKVQLISSAYSLATDNSFMLFLAGSDSTYNSGTNVVFGGYSGGSTSCVIQTGSGSTFTTRASTSSQVPTAALVQFRRVGNVFTVYVNGSSFLTWTDSSGIVPTGSSQRHVRLGLTGNYPIFQSQYQCQSIDEFWAYDLAA